VGRAWPSVEKISEKIRGKETFSLGLKRFLIRNRNEFVMLNPESVMPNLIRHLFRAGLFQHLGFFYAKSFHSGLKSFINFIFQFLCQFFNFFSFSIALLTSEVSSK